jgi:hypothetical protein
MEKAAIDNRPKLARVWLGELVIHSKNTEAGVIALPEVKESAPAAAPIRPISVNQKPHDRTRQVVEKKQVRSCYPVRLLKISCLRVLSRHVIDNKLSYRILPRPGREQASRRLLATGLATEVWCLAIRPKARRLLARTKLKSYRK